MNRGGPLVCLALRRQFADVTRQVFDRFTEMEQFLASDNADRQAEASAELNPATETLAQLREIPYELYRRRSKLLFDIQQALASEKHENSFGRHVMLEMFYQSLDGIPFSTFRWLLVMHNRLQLINNALETNATDLRRSIGPVSSWLVETSTTATATQLSRPQTLERQFEFLAHQLMEQLQVSQTRLRIAQEALSEATDMRDGKRSSEPTSVNVDEQDRVRTQLASFERYYSDIGTELKAALETHMLGTRLVNRLLGRSADTSDESDRIINGDSTLLQQEETTLLLHAVDYYRELAVSSQTFEAETPAKHNDNQRRTEMVDIAHPSSTSLSSSSIERFGLVRELQEVLEQRKREATIL
jgi:hypothetical protein